MAPGEDLIGDLDDSGTRGFEVSSGASLRLHLARVGWIDDDRRIGENSLGQSENMKVSFLCERASSTRTNPQRHERSGQDVPEAEDQRKEGVKSALDSR